MPRGDGTGPAGFGPMTGRGAGFCAGFAVPGYANPVGSRAFGPGFGRGGRGYRNWFHATGMPGWQRAAMGYPAWGRGPAAAPPAPYPQEVSQEDELNFLKQQAEYMEGSLSEIKKKIDELESEKED